MLVTNPNIPNDIANQEARFIQALKKIIRDQATVINELESRIKRLEGKIV